MASGFALRHSTVVSMLVGVALLWPFVSISPARADLRVCNETGNSVSIALGYRAERGWQSEGWWIAEPQGCAKVYQGDLNSRFFYLYVADDIGGGAWDGQVFMCTRDESFTIFGVEDCLARGYERTGFFELDTQNRTDWTLQLTDPVASPTDPGGAASDAESPPLDAIEPGPGGAGDNQDAGPDMDGPPPDDGIVPDTGPDQAGGGANRPPT